MDQTPTTNQICLLLLKSASGAGEALPLQAALYDGIHNASDVKINVNHQSPDLIHSADTASRYIYRALSGEGFLTRAVYIRYTIANTPTNIDGQSAGLAFALCFTVTTLWRRLFPSFAATGVIDDTGNVSRVEGISEKVKAAIAALPNGSLVFVPDDNFQEIDASLLNDAQQRGIKLIGVRRVDEALTRLGVTLNKVYLQSPFRGLEVFEFEHAGVFFGRQEQIVEVCDRLQQQTSAGRANVLVIGASGTGKSSLILAGVLPELVYGRTYARQVDVRFACLRPRDINRQLSAELSSATVDEQIKAMLTTFDAAWHQRHGMPQQSRFYTQGMSVADFARALKNALDAEPDADNIRFVWVIDQLEELFTLGFHAEVQQAFVECLQQFSAAGMWLLGTLRSDFYDRYQSLPLLVSVFEQGIYNLYPPSKEFLEQIITGPANRAGVVFQSDENGVSLSTKLLMAVGEHTDALPLLEATLQELYERRNTATNELTIKAYKDIGGLDGAIAFRADSVFMSLPRDVREALPRVMRALVTIDAENRVLSRTAEFTNAPLTTLVDRFVEARLLIRDEGAGNRIRVTHESLLTHWHRAREAIEEQINLLRIRGHVETQYKRWLESSRERSFLIQKGLALSEASQLRLRWGEDLDKQLLEFITLSVRAQRAARAIKIGLAMAVIAFISFVGPLLWLLREEQTQTKSTMTMMSGEIGDYSVIVNRSLEELGNNQAANRAQTEKEIRGVSQNFNQLSDRFASLATSTKSSLDQLGNDFNYYSSNSNQALNALGNNQTAIVARSDEQFAGMTRDIYKLSSEFGDFVNTTNSSLNNLNRDFASYSTTVNQALSTLNASQQTIASKVAEQFQNLNKGITGVSDRFVTFTNNINASMERLSNEVATAKSESTKENERLRRSLSANEKDIKALNARLVELEARLGKTKASTSGSITRESTR